VRGGAASGAHAAIDPTFVSISGAGDIKLLGGAGDDSYAAIHAPSGPISIHTNGSIVMQAGSGARANAVIAAETGSVFLSALECQGCGVLFLNPVSGSQMTATGVYGTSVDIQVQQGLGSVLEQTVINAVLAVTELASQEGAAAVLEVIATGGSTAPIVIEPPEEPAPATSTSISESSGEKPSGSQTSSSEEKPSVRKKRAPSCN